MDSLGLALCLAVVGATYCGLAWIASKASPEPPPITRWPWKFTSRSGHCPGCRCKKEDGNG